MREAPFEDLPSTRQARAARVADERPHTQVFFQFLDGPRQRRLFDVPPFHRTDEVQFFGNSQEATKMTEFHMSHARSWQKAHALDLAMPSGSRGTQAAMRN